MIEKVRKGKISADEAALKLANFCYCGIFNQVRCADIISETINKKEEKEETVLKEGKEDIVLKEGIEEK